MRVLATIAGLGATAHGFHHGERRAGSWNWGAAVTGVAEEGVCAGGTKSHADVLAMVVGVVVVVVLRRIARMGCVVIGGVLV
jgi:hypothetical protein